MRSSLLEKERIHNGKKNIIQYLHITKYEKENQDKFKLFEQICPAIFDWWDQHVAYCKVKDRV